MLHKNYLYKECFLFAYIVKYISAFVDSLIIPKQIISDENYVVPSECVSLFSVARPSNRDIIFSSFKAASLAWSQGKVDWREENKTFL